MNQFKALHDEETHEPPIECNIQPPPDHLKSRTSTPQNSPVVSSTMVRLNHCTIDNRDVEFHPSEFPVEFKSESVPDPDTTPTKSIDDGEIDHLLEFFHSEHDDDLLYVDL